MAFDITNFQLNKNYVIDASAGTGKTHNIVEIVTKLLQKIPLEKMLIVTYTEKAAGELKDRIRKAINDPKNNISGDVDNASIGTIHSFCQDILKEFPIASHNSSEKTLIDESEIRDFVKRYIREGDIYKDICNIRKGSEILKESELIEKLKAYLGKYYLKKDGSKDTGIIDFDGSFVTNDIIDYFVQNGTIQGYDVLDSKLDIIKNSIFVNNSGTHLNSLYDLLKDSKDLDYNGTTYKSNRQMTVAEQDALKYIKNIKDVLSNCDYYNILIYKYLSDIYKSWQAEKENLSAQTFADMIRNVREAVLAPQSELLKKIQDKYTYAIIDEFQDTNQIQWDIFSKIFLTEGHNIIVVGDPKQSIYAFQGADLAVYDKAKDEIYNNGGIVDNLEKNWRSTENMIISVNKFFDNTNNPEALTQKFAPSSKGSKDFKVEYDGKPVEAFWITDSKDENNGDKPVSSEEYAKLICETIVDCCNVQANGKTKLRISEEDGTTFNNVSFKDFTILARTRSEMKDIENAFVQCGIPYAKNNNNDLYSGRECASWIALMDAVSQKDFMGDNRSYFDKAMITLFFGYSLNDLYNCSNDKIYNTNIMLFSKWRELVEKKEWAKLIEKIIYDTKIAKKLSGLSEFVSFGKIMQIGEECIEYLEKTNSIELLIMHLEKSMKGSDDESEEDENIVAKSTDFDCVQMMTIHASKGLEFPIVISASGLKARYANAKTAYTYHENGFHYLTFDNTQYEKEEKAELQRLYYVAYTRAKYVLILPLFQAPKIRKAIDKSLEFVSNSIKTYKSSCKYRPLIQPSKSIANIKAEVKVILSNNQKNKNNGAKGNLASQISIIDALSKNIYFRGSHKHAYSSLSHGPNNNNTAMDDNKIKQNNGNDDEDSGLKAFDKKANQIGCDYQPSIAQIKLSDNFPAGDKLGNALHDIFEKIDYVDFKNSNAGLYELIKKCFKEYGIRFDDAWLKDIENMIQNVLNAKLPEIQGSKSTNDDFKLSDIEFSDRRNEVEFNYNKENERFNHYFNGFVDLIIKRGEYYSILDWKTDKLRDDFTAYNDKAILKEHVDKCYSIQRVLYSYMLIKWLEIFYGNDDEKIFREHFGGVYYVFLRGCNEDTGNGIYAQTWENFAELKAAYDEIVKEKVH